MKKINYLLLCLLGFIVELNAQSFVFDTAHIKTFNSGNSVFIGNGAGANDDLISNFNVFVGDFAGNGNIGGFNNVALGYQSFRVNQYGDRNVGIGRLALEKLNGGNQNTALGEAALRNLATGNYNTGVGNSAGLSSEGANNTFLGYRSGYNNSGSFNLMLGQDAGYENTGSNNVFLGASSGYNETQSHRLHIDNSITTNPLIYGKFDDDILTVHGKLGVETKNPLAQAHIHDPLSSLAKMLITPQTTSSGDSSTLFFAEDHDASFGMEMLYDGQDNMIKVSGKANSTIYPNNLVIQRSSPKVGIGTDNINGNLEIFDQDEVRVVLNREDISLNGQSKSVIEFQDNGTKLYEFGTWVDDPGLYFLRPDGSTTMYLRGNGQVGVGTISPSAKLQVSDTDATGAAFKVVKSSTTRLQVWENGGLGIGTSLTNWIPANGLFVDGDVNIGRANKSGYKVSIDGKMVAEELLVELSQDWPDYVFDEQYDLMPLDQVEEAIQANHHLPGIPSAAEISETGGVHLGEMQRLMMEKIEELTLHLIRQEKEINALKAQLKNQ